MRIVHSRLFLVGLLNLAMLSTAYAGSVVRLTAPAGFVGPTVHRPNEVVEIEVYVREIPGEHRGTIIQVTTGELDPMVKDAPPEQMGDGADYFLMQFLGGVQQSRTEFVATKPTRVTLDGRPAARVEWTGVGGGFRLKGVMYSVIVGTKVVILHTQGFEDSPAEDRAAALKAIEAVKLSDSESGPH